MKLTELDISAVRNIDAAKLQNLAQTNIVFGANGAGKTTVLESIHILALARSFRSTQLQPVIQYDKAACTVFGRLQRENQPITTIGVRRPRRGGFNIRISGQDVKSVVSLAEVLPIQLINATSYQLLEGGAKQRRQFLDWGVFHVEPSFYAAWRRAQRAIKQRNAILRAGGHDKQLQPWNNELVDVSKQIDRARSEYVRQFIPVFNAMLSRLIRLDGLGISYRPGWDEKLDYADVLNASIGRDRSRGLTHYGPHRSDLKLSFNGIDAGQVLSRGQQKLVVSALRLAQSELLRVQTGRQCILLVDDLPAEIDEERQQRLCALLDSLNMQLFLTCIEPGEITRFCWSSANEPKLFHVKHGVVE